MSTSEQNDRLGLERFDAVDAPDQWAEVLWHAESAGRTGSNVVAVGRGRGWYLAAAASFVALIGGLVVVTQLRNDDGSTPIDQPATDGAGATECVGESDLDGIVALLSSGLPTYDYQPAADLPELIGRNDVVVRAQLTRAVRADGSAPADLGDLGLTTISVSSADVLSGDLTIPVDGFETASQWAVRSQTDPLAEPVTFDQLEVIVFLSGHDDLPSGWTTDIEGWFVACDGGPARGVIESPTFLDLTSLDALEAQITGVERDTTATTEPEPTDSSPAATPPPTDVADTVPESVVVDERWAPSCVERFGNSEAPPADDSLDRFGPLGAVPDLDIALPSYGASEQADSDAVVPNVEVARVDGGVVVIARPYDGQDTDAYVLSVVNDHGSIRWRRCGRVFAGTLMTAPGAAEVTVQEYPAAGESGSATLRTFDLGTGEDREPPIVPDGLDARTLDESFTVFGPGDDRIPTADDRLAVLDHRSGQIHVVPFPSGLGIAAFRHEFEVVDSGNGAFRILQRIDGRQSAVRGVWIDGEWRSDDTTILDATPITAVLTFDEGGWEGRNGLGEAVWARPDLLDIRREGFLAEASDAVTVINGCLEQGEGGCTSGSLLGIDTASGGTLWERSGLRGVSAIGDGFAIITNDAGDGWEMVDTLTGGLVDESQQWAGIEAFAQECCGAGDFVWVGREGGVVFAVNQDHVRAWYPQDHSDATITTTLTD